MDFEIPDDFFSPPKKRHEDWPDHPELRDAVDWLKTFISEQEWAERRELAARRLYDAVLGKLADPAGKGRFFSENDTIGWYLFLAEAFLDHIWNYEPMYGSRVVPVIAAIGRDLPLLKEIDGLNARVGRLVRAEKRQPNGGLFELLVAGAYRRAGAEVEFVEEQPGRVKTHDMNVRLDGKSWAVECKRMETGKYGERERMRMRELWGPSSAWLARHEKSTFCDAKFSVEIDDVPADYFKRKVDRWLASARPSFAWSDEFGCGTISELDLEPLRTVLATDYVLGAGTRVLELLSGQYIRNGNYLSILNTKFASNPRYIDDCNLAILLHWESRAPASIDGKARDIMKRLSDATAQLPDDTPSIVHIGFEAVEGDHVEKARYEKILTTARAFDPGAKRLEYIYCHYFVPESPPDQAWAYDETTQWCPIRPDGPHPLKNTFLVLPPVAESRAGVHWQE